MDEDLEDILALTQICQTLGVIIRRRSKRRQRSVGVLPVWRKRTCHGHGYQLLQELRFNEALFFKYTRLNYERFDYLANLCGPYLQKRKMRTTIPPEHRLAMTLSFLASGDSMTSLAFSYRCGFATVSVIVRETLSVVIHVLHRLAICKPRSTQAWKGVAQGFNVRWNLPHCIGAIDGRHMVIKAPKASGSKFFNYKKTFSIVLLAVADSDYSFISVDVGAEGSQNDAAILNNSEFRKRVVSGDFHIPKPELLPGSNVKMPFFFFAGDGIFQLQANLMKPFALRKLTLEEAIFNYRLSRARRVVENAFGILVARWQVFHAPLCCNLDTAENIVLAAVCLHNFILRSRDSNVIEEYNPTQFVDTVENDGSEILGQWREMIVGENGALILIPSVPRGCPRKATELRKLLMKYVNNEGAVSWQQDHVRKGFWGAHITENTGVVMDARREEEAVDDVVEEELLGRE